MYWSSEMPEARVLLVDDDVLNQWLVTDCLMAEGFVVMGVCRGADAMRVLNEGYEFDLLLTEFHMPDGMSGFELAEHWRRMQPGRPVIYTGDRPEIAANRMKPDEGFIRRHAPTPDLMDVIHQVMHEANLSMLPVAPRRVYTMN